MKAKDRQLPYSTVAGIFSDRPQGLCYLIKQLPRIVFFA